jgi:hypothetical protein
MALRDWIPWFGSMNTIRAKNFTRCVEETDGVKMIDTRSNGDHRVVTFHLNGEKSLNQELIRMLNNKHVILSDLYIEKGMTYVEIKIR